MSVHWLGGAHGNGDVEKPDVAVLEKYVLFMQEPDPSSF